MISSQGRKVRVRLYARGGAVGLARIQENGEPLFVELARVRTHRIRDKNGAYRWYNDYALPEEEGPGEITVRLHGTDEDQARGLNRPENVRPIPPGDPDFPKLYSRRNDAESINRGLDDSMYLGRAHSLGRLRQHAEVLGYALMVNSLTLHRHRHRRPTAVAA